MGPGPTEIHPRVLTTMSQPAIGYLDPVFVDMMEELKSLLRYVYQTKNALTFPASGPGSVGMEYCFVNMVAPGDKVIVCRNGVFGGRMIENVERCGGTPIVVEDNWGEPVDPQKLADALKKNPAFVDLQIVDKWDGITPAIIGGGDKVMLTMQDLERLKTQKSNVPALPQPAAAKSPVRR